VTQGKKVNIILTLENNELVRSRARYKGDMSRIINECISAHLKPVVSEPCTAST
jgi:hypothetical protein